MKCLLFTHLCPLDPSGSFHNCHSPFWDTGTLCSSGVLSGPGISAKLCRVLGLAVLPPPPGMPEKQGTERPLQGAPTPLCRSLPQAIPLTTSWPLGTFSSSKRNSSSTKPYSTKLYLYSKSYRFSPVFRFQIRKPLLFPWCLSYFPLNKWL